MAIFRCKMCGGDLEITEGQAVCTCEFCSTEQTLPRLDSDRKANLYDRANHFRRNNDFDKAMGIYEQILNEDNTDSEAYWSLVLCRYGIEYVEDPATHKRIPTINRAQYTSIYADEDYKAALEHSTAAQKMVYEQEAKTIDEIQKGILAISEKEEPFDVFICYKESDETGRRTPDSVLANDLYHQLTQEGFKVFFARITLEDKLGQEYEPYIFAALNSAKVMVVLGTKPDYFKAVWVKNEWARFLALIRGGAKKMLIPAYKDMDPYDLPEEFSHLQAQDMTKLGFMQDLIRGIKKIVASDKSQTVAKETVVVQQNAASGNITALLKRGNMALEDGEWQKADEFFEEVLNQDAECAEAYMGKLMAKVRENNLSSLTTYYGDLFSDDDDYYAEIIYACDEAKEQIDDALNKYSIKKYVEKSDIAKLYEYDRSFTSMVSCRNMQRQDILQELSGEKLLTRAEQYAHGEYKDVVDKLFADVVVIYDDRIADEQKNDNDNIDTITKAYSEHLKKADSEAESLYEKGLERQNADYEKILSDYKVAKTKIAFEDLKYKAVEMNGYKDTADIAQKCQDNIDKIDEIEEIMALKKSKKENNIVIAIICAIVLFIIGVIFYMSVIAPSVMYKEAVALMNSEEYEEAIDAFETLDGYKDSINQIEICNDKMLNAQYNVAIALMNSEKYREAIEAFEALNGYKDSINQIEVCNDMILNAQYNAVVALMNSEKYEEAIRAFEALNGYKDSINQIETCKEKILDVNYNTAVALINSEKYEEAIEAFEALNGYKDSVNQIAVCTEKILDAQYNEAVAYISAKDYISAYELLNSNSLRYYKDSDDLKNSITNKYKWAKLASANVGDTILFGDYNGNTEWQVLNLDKSAGKILVISKYAIEKRPYNTKCTWVTWEACTLRTWLNGTFLKSAFNSEEQALILSTKIKNSYNPEYYTTGGNSTTDKVFLLSIAEVIKFYFKSDSDMKAGATLINGESTALWLRSPGTDPDYAAIVCGDSSISTFGSFVDSERMAVRPAMWIDISNLE